MTQSDRADVLDVEAYAFVSCTLPLSDCFLPVSGPYTAVEVLDSGPAMGTQLLSSG